MSDGCDDFRSISELQSETNCCVSDPFFWLLSHGGTNQSSSDRWLVVQDVVIDVQFPYRVG